MAVDELSILIEVIDSFSTELDELLVNLSEVEAVAETVDNITIDVDVRGQQELNSLIAQMAALGMMERGVGRNVSAGPRGGVSGAVPQSMMLGGMGGLEGVDEAAESAADSMNMYNRGVEEAGENLDIMNLRMADLHNALARLFPLIAVYIGALPAALGGLVALGAAAASAAAGIAALTGLGALGFALREEMGLMDIAQRIQEDFMDAFEPIARDLAPLFEDALAGLETFFDEVASRGDVLMALRDDARAFGGFLLDWVPDVMEAMGRMAEAFAPLFGRIADGLQEMSVLRGLTQFMAEAAPSFMAFSNAILNIIPTIAEISIGFMDVAAAVTALLNKFINLITLGGRLSEEIGIVIGSMLALHTALGVVNGLMAIFNTVTIQRTIINLATLVTSLNKAAAASILFGTAVRTALTLTGIGAILLGIGAVVGWLGNQFTSAATDIDKATDSLRNFDNVRSNMDGFGGGDGGSSIYQFNPTSRRTIINAENAEDGKRIASYENFTSKTETDNKMASGY